MARENKKFYLSRVSFLDVINVIKNAVTGSLFVSDHHQNPVRLVVLETAIMEATSWRLMGLFGLKVPSV